MSEAALLAQVERPPRRFRRYDEYKDSGVEWLGQIPSHWDAVRMWRIAEAVSGGTPAREELRFWGGPIPWVSPKDMKRRLIDSSEETITDEALAEAGLKLLPPSVVLIVVRGMILAHTFPTAITTVPVTINQDMKALRLRKGIQPEFLAWLFEGLGKGILAAVVDEAAHGTRVIRMERWRGVVMPVPPPHEQEAITAFLDAETARVDELVAKKELLIQLVEEQRESLITRSVTQGVDAAVPMKDTRIGWLGTIPAHWDVKPFKSILARNESGVWGEEAIDGGAIVLRSTEQTIGGDWLIKSPAVRALTAREMTQARLEAGDLVVTKSSGSKAHIGKTSLVDDSVASLGCAFSNFMQRLRLRHPHHARFYWYLLNAPLAREQFVYLSSTTTGLGNLNATILGAIQVPVIPQAEQEAIVSFLDRETARLDVLLTKLRTAIAHLHEFRTALISAAVTGRIDVREEVAA